MREVQKRAGLLVEESRFGDRFWTQKRGVALKFGAFGFECVEFFCEGIDPRV
jgi:hypothetical protein